MSSIDMTIVTVSLPDILLELKTNLAYVSWILTGYQLSSTIIMPIAGKLSDDLGRKRLFLIAATVFTVSSLCSGFSPNIYLLIVFRILQGLGGGAIMPCATGIISDTFGNRRTTAIGLFASIFPIGGIIGPNLGGFLVDNLSWRWIFFVNIPIGALLLLLGTMIIPGRSPSSSNVRGPKSRVDFAGIGLFSGAILAILYALTDWSNNSSASNNTGVITWGLLAAGVILLALFIRQEGKAKQPMIEIKLLKWRPFLAAIIYTAISGAVGVGMFSFIPYYASIAYGMSAGQNGYILTPRSIAMIVMATISSVFIIRSRYRLPMLLGIILVALSCILLSRGYHDFSIFGLHIQDFFLLMLVVMIGGIGMGITNPAATNAVIDLAPEKVSVVTGIRGMFRVIGGIFGTIAVVMLLSRYEDKAAGLQQIFLYFAILFLAVIPLIFLIPDTARLRRKQARSSADKASVSER